MLSVEVASEESHHGGWFWWRWRAVASEAGHAELWVSKRPGGVAVGVWLSLTLLFLQPCLLAPAPSLGDGSDSGLSDSEESVFSGLEDSGSDSSEDATEEEDGASCSEGHGGTEETTGQQVQVGELGPLAGVARKESAQEPSGSLGGCPHTAFSKFPDKPQVFIPPPMHLGHVWD